MSVNPDNPTQPVDRVARLTPSKLLTILLTEFVVLLFLLLCFNFKWLYIDQLPVIIAGVLPLAVPWAGAMGGVTFGLVSLVSNWPKWKAPRQGERFNAWYLTRLPIGCVFGTIAAMIVVLFLGVVATNADGTPDVSAIGAATLFVVAFIVGFQQDVFRSLVERVVQVLLGPGKTTDDDKGFTVGDKLDFGEVAVNARSSGTVPIVNLGSALMNVTAAAMTVDNDAFSVSRVPGKLAGNDGATIELTFEPNSATAFTGNLVVAIDGTSRTVSLSGTGM